ncbi:MAG: AbrB/MazE/SpoVT family DNA-binding domain-containing protein [Candidatus Bathyarchaeia archaeon]
MKEKIKKKVLRVISGGRITLPKEYRERNDLRVGDYLIMICKDKSLELSPIMFRVRE